MHSPSLWQALQERRYVRSSWPWRSALYLLTSVPLGIATLATVLLLAVAGSVLTAVLIGIPLLLTLALTGIPLAALERRRVRLLDRDPIPGPHREPHSTGLSAWLRTRLQERATWRELGYALLFACLLWPLEGLAVGTVLTICGGLIATPAMMAAGGDEEARVLKLWIADSYPEAFAALLAGVLLLPVLAYPLGVLAAGRAVLTRQLLSIPETGLDSRIQELGRSRMRLVDAFEAERRRIERDLHDGAQQRLVALSMTLGLARLENPAEPLGSLLTKAQEEAGVALVEIRELIRGIHPQVLTDRGLEAAVEDIADRSAVPVDVSFELPGRMLEAIETAVYFAICEALANVAKHSRATRAKVTGQAEKGRLTVEVEDNGIGGADTVDGTGLQGVADRISVLGGHLLVSSPPGGPTVFRLQVPCSPARSRT
ncbi:MULTISPECIES: sensor histidine kinase [Streptomyces]|uniref:sensor histidine kinase n=1 Tax=Streptomyces TaxID=1883 RepID=UPI001C855BD5|nr:MULTISPECIES: sensor histidine kinase [unclassified Streptomyces]MCX2925556.1 sensor domain-containing protein [Streptomyces sp. NEAU-W12]